MYAVAIMLRSSNYPNCRRKINLPKIHSGSSSINSINNSANVYTCCSWSGLTCRKEWGNDGTARKKRHTATPSRTHRTRRRQEEPIRSRTLFFYIYIFWFFLFHIFRSPAPLAIILSTLPSITWYIFIVCFINIPLPVTEYLVV